MSPVEAAVIAREVVAAFDVRSGVWVRACDSRSEDADRLARMFGEYEPKRIVQLVGEWVRETPERAPKPTELATKLRGGVQEFSPDACTHPEPWGFDVLENHDRECFCRLCGFTWVVPPDGVLTPLELEKGPRRDVA